MLYFSDHSRCILFLTSFCDGIQKAEVNRADEPCPGVGTLYKFIFLSSKFNAEVDLLNPSPEQKWNNPHPRLINDLFAEA